MTPVGKALITVLRLSQKLDFTVIPEIVPARRGLPIRAPRRFDP